MYVDEGMRAYSIAVRLTDEGVPTQTGKLMWLQSRVHHILGNATYAGTWVYGKYRHVATEDGMKVYDQPRDTWIEIPVPQVIDDETWERAQKLKRQRSTKAKRNTKVLYLLQHLLKCGECGRNFHTRASWTTTSVRNGKAYTYDLTAPRRYYMCNGMQGMRLRCREKPYIRAEQLEEPIWSEVKRVLQNPDLIVAGIDTLDAQGERRNEEGDRPGRARPAEHPDGRGPRHQAVRVGEDHRGPTRPSSASSSPSGLRAPGRSWTITVLWRRVEQRSGD